MYEPCRNCNQPIVRAPEHDLYLTEYQHGRAVRRLHEAWRHVDQRAPAGLCGPAAPGCGAAPWSAYEKAQREAHK